MRLSDLRDERRQAEINRKISTSLLARRLSPQSDEDKSVRLARLVAQFKRAVEHRRETEVAVLRVLGTPRAKEIILAVVTEAIQRRIGVV